MPHFDLDILSLENAAEWDSFVSSSPQASPFALTSWLRIYSQKYSVPVRMICARRNGALIAGVIASERRKSPFVLSPPVPISLYTGLFIHRDEFPAWLTNGEFQKQIIQSLFIDGMKEFNFHSTTLHFSIADADPFKQTKWTVQQRFTYILDIHSPELCWQQFNQSLRRKIRRADEEGLHFCESKNSVTLIEQQIASYHRRNIEPPIPRRILLPWIEELTLERLIRIFELRDNAETPLAARAIICYGDTVYDLVAGMNTTTRIENASHLLLWNIITKMSESGFRALDFMGANSPGPTEFKRSFGGERVPYLQLTYFSSRAIKTLEAIHNYIGRKRRGVA